MKKIVTYGIFDKFHYGHLSLLKRARELGDFLIVGVVSDEYAQDRGKLCVVDSLETRMENIRKTGLADEVLIEDHDSQKVEDIVKYGIDALVCGSDWQGKFDYLKPYCKVIYLPRTEGISSTMIRNQKYPKVRVGMIGNGRIAHRFVKEALAVEGICLTGVYNPHQESASAFALQEHLTHVWNTPEEMYEDVDAVYICSPHQTHDEYTEDALTHHKHVLCEKPLSFKEENIHRLYALAEQNHLVLMEGIKTAYCPGFLKLMRTVNSGVIGEVTDIEASFTRLTDDDLREWTDDQFGGSFTEFGSYVLLPVIKLYGTDVQVDHIHSTNKNHVDSYTKMILSCGNKTATVKTGIGVKTEGQMIIAGTKGYIVVDAPWWKTTRFEVRHEDPNQEEIFESRFVEEGLRYEISDFLYRIEGHPGRDDRLTAEESAAIGRILEQFLRARQ